MLRSLFLVLLLLLALPVPAHAAPRVALLLDQECAGLDYGKSLVQALQRARQTLGTEGDVWIAPRGQEEERLLALAQGGYDLIIVPPALHLALAGNAGNFPKIRFCALDGRVKAPHILSITFAEAESALLAGAAAALVTGKTLPGINQEHLLGWVGCKDTRDTRGALAAFIKGAQLADPSVQVLTAFTGSPATSEEFYAAAKKLYAQGADIVAAGESIAAPGVLRAARESGGYAIGIDVDQNAQAPGHVLLSRLKALELSVLGCIRAVNENTFQGGIWERHLHDGGVGITECNALQHAWGKAFPQELPQLLTTLQGELERGAIQLGTPPRSGCDCLNDE